MIGGFDLLYLAGLATITGYLLIGRVPSLLHTPMLAGSSLVHGIVLVGAIGMLFAADSLIGRLIGFLAVGLASANVVGAFVVSDRLLGLFDRSTRDQRDVVTEDRRGPPS